MDNWTDLLEQALPARFLGGLHQTGGAETKQAEGEVVIRALQCALTVRSAPDEIRDDISIAILREVLDYIVEPMRGKSQEAPDARKSG